MIKTTLKFCTGALFLFFTITSSATLPLSSKLIGLASPEGNEIFQRSYERTYFWPLMFQFTYQQNRTYCTIASSVMVLNALDIPAPIDQNFMPYRTFTQNNFFTPEVQNFMPMSQLKKSGATINQVGHALSTFPVSVQIVHANTVTANEFRSLAKQAIAHGAYLLVNFSRTALGQDGTGHMSPIGAYDEISDRFLILDVSRFRYPPFWVKTNDLWKAMHTIDQGAHVYRGFLIVARQQK